LMLPECRPHSLALASSHHQRPSRSACTQAHQWLYLYITCWEVVTEG
jgi:hypothetical protein